MSNIRSIKELPYENELGPDTYVVSETASKIRGVRIGDIVDYVVAEARKELATKKPKSKKPQPSPEEVQKRILERIARKKLKNAD